MFSPRLLCAALAAASLCACATQTMAPANVPDAVKAPSGAAYMLTLVGVGDLTYECRNANNATAWAFVGPNAALRKTSGETVGKYYGGPTWEGNDGSKLVGKQLAISPAAAGNIPLQLVEVTQTMGSGMLVGAKYIQRLNTVGGVAPAAPCGASNVGEKQTVKYQADYAFYK
jgi:hypothetical protein